ncbi:MAG TPA: trypsin-like peptidase domain-containing protein [Pyrinomonadaceae bacterium]|nr:trypsin-like peptidase domain-containing protein [Pyrinomonadaceae bacterium]
MKLLRRRHSIVFLAIVIVANSVCILAQTPPNFASVAKQVEPAVVSIDTKRTRNLPIARETPRPGENKELEELINRQLQQPIFGVGSGFIVDKSGLIVTNRHVVAGSGRVIVRLDNGDEFDAKVLGTDLETDIAVLKIETGRELPFLKFGNSNSIEIGEWVLAVGSPFGLAKTVTAGIISQKRRETPYTSPFQRFIQTDAAINPGNSGGPLVNLQGEVVGVNSQIATASGEFSGVAFALPADTTEIVYRQIVANGRVRRGYLGAFLESVKPEYAKVFGLPQSTGAIIMDIRDKKAAAAASGLLVGDIVTEINGSRIESANDMISRIAATAPDQNISIVYYREVGDKLERKELSLKLGERPSNDLPDADSSERRPLTVGPVTLPKPFGLTLVEYTAAMNETYRFGTQKGLIVRTIDTSHQIADIRNNNGNRAVEEGDLIQRINRQTVTDAKTFTDIVSKLKPGDPVVLHLLTYVPQLDATQLKIVQFTVK